MAGESIKHNKVHTLVAGDNTITLDAACRSLAAWINSGITFFRVNPTGTAVATAAAFGLSDTWQNVFPTPIASIHVYADAPGDLNVYGTG